MYKIILKTIFILFLTQTLQARDDIYSQTFDSIYVAQKIYYSLDKKLNRTYSSLKRHLGRNGKRILINTSKEWIYRRNHLCSFPRTSSVDIGCAVRMTRQRVYFLEDRLRECQEIGCKLNRF